MFKWSCDHLATQALYQSFTADPAHQGDAAPGDHLSLSCTLPQSTANKDRIFDVLQKSKKGKLPVVDADGCLVALATRHHSKAHMFFPGAGEPSKDARGRLLCGAAIGTRPGDRDRVAALAAEGIDAVILDSSQGDSTYQLDMIAHVKRAHPEVDVIAGNVVTSRQARRWGWLGHVMECSHPCSGGARDEMLAALRLTGSLTARFQAD